MWQILYLMDRLNMGSAPPNMGFMHPVLGVFHKSVVCHP